MAKVDELKGSLGDELCEYCPWNNGEIDHLCYNVCEGRYCDDALGNFLEENEDYFDEE